MTRLNIIEPEHLTRVHLVAEYKEITQFLHLIQRRIHNNVPMDDIPEQYTLNGGHCKFFYNKGKYVQERFTDLYYEMLNREIRVDKAKYLQRLERIILSYTDELRGDYSPSLYDYSIAIDRITERINQKPHLYNDKEIFFNNVSRYI